MAFIMALCVSQLVDTNVISDEKHTYFTICVYTGYTEVGYSPLSIYIIKSWLYVLHFYTNENYPSLFVHFKVMPFIKILYCDWICEKCP